MHYTRIVLSGKYQEIGSQVMRLVKPAPKLNFRFDLFYENVERVVGSRSIHHVLVERRKDFFAPAFGGLEEIRAGLERLSRAGKEVYYYAPEYSASDCMLAAVCKHRIMHPLGQLSFQCEDPEKITVFFSFGWAWTAIADLAKIILRLNTTIPPGFRCSFARESSSRRFLLLIIWYSGPSINMPSHCL